MLFSLSSICQVVSLGNLLVATSINVLEIGQFNDVITERKTGGVMLVDRLIEGKKDRRIKGTALVDGFIDSVKLEMWTKVVSMQPN